jgi:hypothetical protein
MVPPVIMVMTPEKNVVIFVMRADIAKTPFDVDGQALHTLTEQAGQQTHRDTHQGDGNNAQNQQVITHDGSGQSGHHAHDATEESGNGSDQSSHTKTSLLSFDMEHPEKQRDHKNTKDHAEAVPADALRKEIRQSRQHGDQHGRNIT